MLFFKFCNFPEMEKMGGFLCLIVWCPVDCVHKTKQIKNNKCKPEPCKESAKLPCTLYCFYAATGVVVDVVVES